MYSSVRFLIRLGPFEACATPARIHPAHLGTLPPAKAVAELLELAQGQVTKCCGHLVGRFVEALRGSCWAIARIPDLCPSHRVLSCLAEIQILHTIST